MALVQWKQISPYISGSGNLTGSLNITGSIFLNGDEVTPSVFRRTGSYYSATSDIKITGSLNLNFDGIEDYFSIQVNGTERFKVNEEGVMVLSAFDETPSAIAGGMFYSSSDAYYLGFVE